MSGVYQRKFLKSTFDPLNVSDLQSVFNSLETTPLSDAGSIETWILQWDELARAVRDREARAYVAMTCDTADQKANELYLKLVKEVMPVFETCTHRLSEKLLDSPRRSELRPYYRVLLRDLETERKLFNEKAVAIKADVKQLEQEYEQIAGSWMVSLKGQELTVPQAWLYTLKPDRALREKAAIAVWKTRDQSRKKLHELYDRMVEKRSEIAALCGFSNFRDYKFKALHRYDYGPRECEAFAEGVAAHVVPLNVTLAERRKRALKIDRLKPYDLEVETLANAEPPKFSIGELVAKCQRVFDRIRPEFGAFFKTLRQKSVLDLESRKGKAPGGYMTEFPEAGLPFIFMNSVGSAQDMRTLVHEAGHCFHYMLASAHQPLFAYHMTGSEFAEVASMTMELFARPSFELFFEGEKLAYYRDNQIEDILEILPRIAIIDSFQHWVYTHPGHTHAEREEKYCELRRRFLPQIDYEGLEQYESLGWIYPHIFAAPFYYIEYGIAQLCALQIWMRGQTEFQPAVEAYRSGLSLGGSKSLPELFQTVGVRFDFGPATIAPIATAMANELGLG